MPDAVGVLRICRAAARVSFADLRAIYSWQSWLFGYLVRVTAQVAFYGLLGVLVVSESAVAFLIIGAAALAAAMAAFAVIASTTWERRGGTLTLALASPGSPVAMLYGRSIHWVLDGWASASGALIIASILFGLALPPAGVVEATVILAIVAWSSYSFGFCLAAFVLRAPGLRNVISNVTYFSLGLVAGAFAPVGSLPVPTALPEILPLTHGLAAIRLALGGSFSSVELGEQVGLEATVGIAWLIVGVFAFRWTIRRSRARADLGL